MTSLTEFLEARIREEMERYSPRRNGKTRIMAECKAKLAIMELHDEDRQHACPTSHGDTDFGHLHGWAEETEYPQRCPTLRILAAVYADHRDYDPTWAPEATDGR